MKDNPEFTVDRLSEAYMQRHPHMRKQIMKEQQEQAEKL